MKLNKIKREPRKYKARLFAREYINTNFNGARAVLRINPNLKTSSASTTAWSLLKTEDVQREIKEVLRSQGLTLDVLLSKLKENTFAGVGVKATARDANRGLETMLKLYGLLGSKQDITKVSIQAKYNELPISELKSVKNKLDQQYNSILEGEILPKTDSMEEGVHTQDTEVNK